MLDIKIEVKMKSGAKVELSHDQVETVAKWVEGLIFQGVPKAQNPSNASTKKHHKQHGSKPWSAEEDRELGELAKAYPIHTPGRQQAMERFANGHKRTKGAVEVRLYKLFPVKSSKVEISFAEPQRQPEGFFNRG